MADGVIVGRMKHISNDVSWFGVSHSWIEARRSVEEAKADEMGKEEGRGRRRGEGRGGESDGEEDGGGGEGDNLVSVSRRAVWLTLTSFASSP